MKKTFSHVKPGEVFSASLARSHKQTSEFLKIASGRAVNTATWCIVNSGVFLPEDEVEVLGKMCISADLTAPFLIRS